MDLKADTMDCAMVFCERLRTITNHVGWVYAPKGAKIKAVWSMKINCESDLEESEGFEPSVPLPALRISSATLSTTQPTLLAEEAASKGGIRVWQAIFLKNI